jgi:arginase
VRTDIGVFGAPSSAGAYAPGQERAPAALREIGLIGGLERTGARVTDHGDTPAFRWRPDTAYPRAQNLGAVERAIHAVEERVAAALQGGEFALILGGDCTVGIGTVSALVRRHRRPGLVYLDRHADMNTPASVIDGALDWTGLGHMLDVPDAVTSLAGIGGRRPLLAPEDVVLLGYDHGAATPWEHEQIDRLSPGVIPLAAVQDDPAGAAAEAMARLAGCDAVAVHFDVDLIDFTDAPLSENTGRNEGTTLDAAMSALAALVADDRTIAVTVTELNPLHGAEDGSTLRRFADGLTAVLGAPARAST